MAGILSNSLQDLPGIESIDLSDNNLTDLSLVPCIKALSFIPNLTEINLSFNVIGSKSADAISEYLNRKECSLQKLILQNADIDDCGCAKFIKHLHTNDTLTYIDLSGNKIGTSEGLNIVKKTIITGGEAIAELLVSKSMLKTLILGWNMIRLNSAVKLASSLTHNKTLIYLDLSNNSLGRDGGEILGKYRFLNFNAHVIIIYLTLSYLIIHFYWGLKNSP